MPLETAWTTGRTIWPCSATWRSTSWAGRKVRHPYEQNSKKPHGITIISSNSSPYFEMRLPWGDAEPCIIILDDNNLSASNDPPIYDDIDRLPHSVIKRNNRAAPQLEKVRNRHHRRAQDNLDGHR